MAQIPDHFGSGDLVCLKAPRRCGKTTMLLNRLEMEAPTAPQGTLIVTNLRNVTVGLQLSDINIHDFMDTEESVWLYLDDFAFESFIPHDVWDFVLNNLMPRATKIRMATCPAPGPFPRDPPAGVAVYVEHR